MTLQAALDAALPELRREAESRMTSSCTIRRKTSRTTQDESTGREVAVWEFVHTNLPCRVAGTTRGQSSSRTETDGGVKRTTSLRTLHLPAKTDDLLDDDLAELTAGECAGLVYRLVEVDRADQQTARRIPVEQTQRPDEWG